MDKILAELPAPVDGKFEDGVIAGVLYAFAATEPRWFDRLREFGTTLILLLLGLVLGIIGSHP